jgi:fructose transport system ATP-binding protein
MFFGALIVGVFDAGAPAARRRCAMDVPSHRRAHHRRRDRRPVDQKGVGLMEPILKGRNLVKRYGKVTALDIAISTLARRDPGRHRRQRRRQVDADQGDLRRCGARRGQDLLEGKEVRFPSPIDARDAGIETVYQTLAMSPALSIADNMFMGREMRKPGLHGQLFRQLDRKAMDAFAREKL